MTYIPLAGLWSWNVMGEHAQYLSQPLANPLTLAPLALKEASARCQYAAKVGAIDDSLWTGDIQCGVLGWPDIGGTTWRCVLHRTGARCDRCGGFLLSSPACPECWDEDY